MIFLQRNILILGKKFRSCYKEFNYIHVFPTPNNKSFDPRGNVIGHFRTACNQENSSQAEDSAIQMLFWITAIFSEIEF